MDVAALYVEARQVFGQFFRHSLGQGGHQHAVSRFDGTVHFIQQIIHLSQTGPYLNRRVNQTRWPDQLLHNYSFRLLKFKIGRGGTHINGLTREVLKFIKFKRTVVHCRGKPESIFNQGLLARFIPAIHGPDLRYRYMAFVNNRDKIIGEIIQQAERP